MKINWKKEIVLITIVLFPLVSMVYLGNDLPASIPIHWNFDGQADGYGSKYLLPFMSVVLYLILLLTPDIDPRKENYVIFQDRLYKIRLIVGLFFSLVNELVLLTAWGLDLSVPRILSILILFLIVVLGNYLGSIRTNWFLGIRTPWTLENEQVWRKTHFFSGRLWFFSGLAGLMIVFFLDKIYLSYFIVVFTLVISSVPVLYSYLQYKKVKNN